MFEMAREVIGTQPILAIFLAIGLGYLVGQINLGGFSLGVGAVLFVGLAIGAFAPKSQIVGPISLIGLIMFLYGIGILYGRQFFEGMIGAAGRKYNLLALVAVRRRRCSSRSASARPSASRSATRSASTPARMTSTATLQAALDVMRNKEPSIGYSVAYPFGVIGPILCIYFMTRKVQPKFPPKAPNFHMGEITLAAKLACARSPSLMQDLPAGVKMTMVRKDSQNMVPSDEIILAAGDGVMIISDRQDDIATAAAASGASSQVASSRTAPISTTSGFSSAKPMWSGCPSRTSPACRLPRPHPACQAV